MELCFRLQNDIETDRKGKGRTYLREHPARDSELVASPFVYHSRASAIEGQFRLFHSRASWLAAAAGASDSSSGTCGRNGPSAGGCAAGTSMPAFFCERGWDRCTGRPWLMR